MEEMMLICAEESDSSVGFYHARSGEEVARVRVGTWPHELCLSHDGRTLYVSNFGVKDYDERIGDPGASISVIDVAAKVETHRLYTFRNRSEYRRYRGPHGLQLTPDGRQLFVNVETEDSLLIFDLAEDGGATALPKFWRLEEPQPGRAPDDLPDELAPLPEGTHNLLLSPDGTVMWVTSAAGGVSEYDVATKRKLRSFYCKGAVRGLSYTADLSHLIASASGEVCLVNPATLVVEKRFEVEGVRQFLYSRQTGDGRYLLCPAVWEGQLLRIDMATDEVRRMIVGSDPIHVVPGPETTAYVSHGRSRYVQVVDWEAFEPTGRIPTRGGPNGIVLAPYSSRPLRKRLKFGAPIPLSGGSADEGQDLRLGYQYWAERVNEAGGLKVGESVYDVEVVYRDTRSRTGANPDLDPKPWDEDWRRRSPPKKNSIEETTEELIAHEEPQFLFGTYPSPPNLHVARIGAEHGLPVVTASGAASIIYEKGLKNVFGIMSTANGFLNETFVYLARLPDPPRTAMFWSCEDAAATQDAVTTAAFIKAKLGMEVRTSSAADVKPGAEGVLPFRHLNADFSRLVEIARAADPDVLAITGHLGESMAAVQALAGTGYAPKAIVFSVGPAFPHFSAQLGPLARHLAGSAMWSAVQDSYGHDRFIRPSTFARDFFDRFSKEASYLAAGAMACGLVYEEAFRRAGSVDPERVMTALSGDGFRMSTFYSNIEFSEGGLNTDRPLLTIQLREEGGRMLHIPVWPVELASGGSFVWPFPGWPER